jgi:hypothetical protein
MTTNDTPASRAAASYNYFVGFFLGRPAHVWRDGLANARRREQRPTSR